MKYYIQFAYSYDFPMTEAYDTIEEVRDKIKEIERGGMYIEAIFHGDRIDDEVKEWMDKNDN